MIPIRKHLTKCRPSSLCCALILCQSPISHQSVTNPSVSQSVSSLYIQDMVSATSDQSSLRSFCRENAVLVCSHKSSSLKELCSFYDRFRTRIYNQCILPVLTYGAETWVTTKAILQKLIVTQRAMERKLVGVSLRDRMTNKWLRKESKVSDIVKRIANLKWQWAGHIARKSDSWCKDLLEWRPWEHKRPVGRPQMRWKDDIRKVAGQNWMLVAQDRVRWKGLKEAYTKLVEEGLR
ncbi:hypothetical protein ABMA27_010206 [Loxostege sticticalis]|uniref:Endonuclease-reverse transcriptase n=1 Tax=Loxostege sticticalis TaxID=481309 RepID=A0ABR3H4Z3_LOXSC